MSVRFDCGDPSARSEGIARAASAADRGSLVVMPTDTVYGVGTDAFSPGAVAALRAARGVGRGSPPPVLVPHARTLDGVAARITPVARALADAFWPGPLTLLCHAQPTLDWDLGDAAGLVAVRMPLHPVALELLDRVGPMAVTAASEAGTPAPTTCDAAQEHLGDVVAVYLDAGPSPGGVASTIVAVTEETPRVLRPGAIAVEQLRAVAGEIEVGV